MIRAGGLSDARERVVETIRDFLEDVPPELLKSTFQQLQEDLRAVHRAVARKKVSCVLCESCFSAYGIERLLQEQADEDLRKIEEEREAIGELYRGERPCRVMVEVWGMGGLTIDQHILDLPRLPREGDTLQVGDITCCVRSVSVESPRSTDYVASAVAEPV